MAGWALSPPSTAPFLLPSPSPIATTTMCGYLMKKDRTASGREATTILFFLSTGSISGLGLISLILPLSPHSQGPHHQSLYEKLLLSHSKARESVLGRYCRVAARPREREREGERGRERARIRDVAVLHTPPPSRPLSGHLLHIHREEEEASKATTTPIKARPSVRKGLNRLTLRRPFQDPRVSNRAGHNCDGVA